MNFGIYTLIIENHMKRLSGFGMFDFGWGMGYVLLPYNHPYYGKNYDDINAHVHGGLTFGQVFDSEYFLKWIENKEICGDVTIENFRQFNNYWIIGFDTNHYGDDLNNCSKSYVINETNSLAKQCLKDNIEGMKKYKSFYFRKAKLKLININIEDVKFFDHKT